MNTPTLFVASGNAGKLRDFATATATYGSSWTIAPVPGLATIAAPDENGQTFEANAREKALYYARYVPGAIVLADDSGLELDALDGAPGVYSARFAEKLGFTSDAEKSQDERNNACVLRELSGFPDTRQRVARYRCVLAAARDGTVLAIAEGSVPGQILSSGRGEGGFGYDPLFWLPQLERTMAELDAETRLGLSHRGAALQRLLPQLAGLLLSH